MDNNNWKIRFMKATDLSIVCKCKDVSSQSYRSGLSWAKLLELSVISRRRVGHLAPLINMWMRRQTRPALQSTVSGQSGQCIKYFFPHCITSNIPQNGFKLSPVLRFSGWKRPYSRLQELYLAGSGGLQFCKGTLVLIVSIVFIETLCHDLRLDPQFLKCPPVR